MNSGGFNRDFGNLRNMRDGRSSFVNIAMEKKRETNQSLCVYFSFITLTNFCHFFIHSIRFCRKQLYKHSSCESRKLLSLVKSIPDVFTVRITFIRTFSTVSINVTCARAPRSGRRPYLKLHRVDHKNCKFLMGRLRLSRTVTRLGTRGDKVALAHPTCKYISHTRAPVANGGFSRITATGLELLERLCAIAEIGAPARYSTRRRGQWFITAVATSSSVA